jgi:predicted pyridoxine 5'-phosphate oxidase superfamily flavin-nucleotide-binding protein
MLSSEVLNYASRSVLCWLATVDENGQPNVSPKEIFAVFDSEHLVIANIASPMSVRNIGVNPRVCVSFIDVFVQKGFKVHWHRPKCSQERCGIFVLGRTLAIEGWTTVPHSKCARCSGPLKRTHPCTEL